MPAPLGGLVAVVDLFAAVIIAAAVGRSLLMRLLPDSTPEERAVLGFPVGMALVAILTMILLFARLPVRGVVLGALAGGALWSRRELLPTVRSVAVPFRDLLPLNRPRALVAWLTLVVGAFALIGCLAPETGWDSGVYHFATARLRAEEGWMVVRRDIPHGYRPAYMEMLYTLGFAFQGETLASLVNFAFYFSGLSLARLWAGRLGGERARFVGALAFFSCTTFIFRNGGGDVEMGQTVFLATALYALVRLRERGAAGWRVLAGGALGILLGMKYASAWAIFAIALVWAIVRGHDRAGFKTLLMDGCVLSLLVFAIGSPWYIRNQLVVGNFLYPLAETVSGPAGAAEPTSLNSYSNLARGIGLDGWVIAAFPALLVAEASSARWVVGALVLFFLLIVRQLGLSPAALENAWRYGSPAFLIYVALSGVGVEALRRRSRPKAAIASVVLGCFLAASLAVHGYRNVRKLPVAIGASSREAYLEERINSYWAIRQGEALLPAGKKMLLVEQRVYYCRAPFLAASDIQTEVRFDALATGEQLRRFLDERGIGMIVYNHSSIAKTWGFKGVLDKSPEMLSEARVRLLETRNDCSLFAVN